VQRRHHEVPVCAACTRSGGSTADLAEQDDVGVRRIERSALAKVSLIFSLTASAHARDLVLDGSDRMMLVFPTAPINAELNVVVLPLPVGPTTRSSRADGGELRTLRARLPTSDLPSAARPSGDEDAHHDLLAEQRPQGRDAEVDVGAVLGGRAQAAVRQLLAMSMPAMIFRRDQPSCTHFGRSMTS
jgi:hypothetical protein